MARRRSISTPITLGAFSVALCITMLVLWIVLMVRDPSLSSSFRNSTSLMVFGISSFALILLILILFCVFLVRETLELRRQTSFIDSVTHELKSPLASLSLATQTLARTDVSDAQRRQLREMMRRDVDRLAAFIQDILEANRVEHGRSSYVVEDVNLQSCLDALLRELGRRHDFRDVEIHRDVPDSLSIRTDRVALETILKNLIDNGIKYSNPPAHITITGRLKERWVCIDIKDEGFGIAPLQTKRIFERFYRVPGESERSRKGTGLGLFVVGALTKNIGARLRVESEGLGKGSVFTLELPRQRK